MSHNNHQSAMTGGFLMFIFKGRRRHNMRIPEKVKVLYKEYGISEQVNLHDEKGELFGQIHYLPQEIVLNADAAEEQKKATLVHEIVHALDEMYNIGLKEKQVEKLGTALYMLQKDNPVLSLELIQLWRARWHTRNQLWAS